ncbi:MAG: hypothetical protein AB8H80_07690 [Planctomycetota bacterium]
MLRFAMPRATLLFAVGLLAGADFARPAHAQSQRPHPPTALLYDPSGAPVADAQGWLRPTPDWQLRALAATALPTFLRPGGPGKIAGEDSALAARSDRRGILRFDGGGRDGRNRTAAGSGLVRTAEGLGALLFDLRAGRAQRCSLQPMGLVTTSSGSEPFTLAARARAPNGRTFDLPLLRGTEVRLPAGDYEVWARSADGILWQRLQLAANSREVLVFTKPAQRLQIGASAHIQPVGWPSFALSPAADATDRKQTTTRKQTIVTLRGAAIQAPLLRFADGIVDGPRVLSQPPGVRSRAPLIWPRSTIDQTQGARSTPERERAEDTSTWRQPERAASAWPAKHAPPGTRLFGLLRDARGTYAVKAWATPNSGRIRMPAAPPGDAWLLLTAPGKATTARPWPRGPITSWAPPSGVELAVRVAGSGASLPAVDVALEYIPDDQSAATVLARSDARGIARFGPVVAPGLLRCSDPNHRNQTIELDRIPAKPLPMTIERGERCLVRARFDDGSTNGTIVVTLRDPTGTLRPATRTQVLAPGETATFVGLPAHGSVVLFATARRSGHTFSARQRVRLEPAAAAAAEEALQTPIELVLRDEDPRLR